MVVVEKKEVRMKNIKEKNFNKQLKQVYFINVRIIPITYPSFYNLIQAASVYFQ